MVCSTICDIRKNPRNEPTWPHLSNYSGTEEVSNSCTANQEWITLDAVNTLLLQNHKVDLNIIRSNGWPNHTAYLHLFCKNVNGIGDNPGMKFLMAFL